MNVVLEVDNTQMRNIQELTKLLNRSRPEHVPELSAKSLLEMLAEDLSMVYSRPGSWEGSNMADVLQGHGFRL